MLLYLIIFGAVAHIYHGLWGIEPKEPQGLVGLVCKQQRHSAIEAKPAFCTKAKHIQIVQPIWLTSTAEAQRYTGIRFNLCTTLFMHI